MFNVGAGKVYAVLVVACMLPNTVSALAKLPVNVPPAKLRPLVPQVTIPLGPEFGTNA